jgi:hypothetical protein
MHFRLKDREALRASLAKEFGGTERTSLKATSGNDDEINAFKIMGIDDPSSGGGGEEGTVEENEEDDDRYEGQENKGQTTKTEAKGHEGVPEAQKTE